MVGAFDDYQLSWFGDFRYEVLKLRFRTELVTGSTDEELRLVAAFKIGVIVVAVVDRRDGKAESNSRSHPVVRAGNLHTDCGSKGKSGEDQGQMKSLVKPVEGGAYIVDFPTAVIVLPLAQARAAEIESKHRKSEAVQGFHRMEDHFVVERAAKQRMRMADEGGMGGVLGSNVEKGFKPPGVTF